MEYYHFVLDRLALNLEASNAVRKSKGNLDANSTQWKSAVHKHLSAIVPCCPPISENF